jgi:hypothetical protein
MLYFKEKNGTLSINIQNYAKKLVDKNYPLIDVEIKSFDKKIEKHVVWWKRIKALEEPAEEEGEANLNPFNK